MAPLGFRAFESRASEHPRVRAVRFEAQDPGSYRRALGHVSPLGVTLARYVARVARGVRQHSENGRTSCRVRSTHGYRGAQALFCVHCTREQDIAATAVFAPYIVPCVVPAVPKSMELVCARLAPGAKNALTWRCTALHCTLYIGASGVRAAQLRR